MMTSNSRAVQPYPPVTIDLPTRPSAGRKGALLYHLTGRGLSPPGPLPLQEWMKANLVDGIDDEDGLRRVFEGQVGARWRGFAEAGTHTKALLLRVAAAYFDDKALEEIDGMLGRIMSCAPDAMDDTAMVDAVVARFGGRDDFVELVERFAAFHGFERTLLLGFTQWVIHRKGVLPLRNNDVPWLAYTDQTSWLGLRFLGLRVFTVEVAGLFSHLLFEKVEKKAIAAAQVTNAIEGTRTAWFGDEFCTVIASRQA